MRRLVRQFAGPAFLFLVGTGFSVSGVHDFRIASALWIAALIWAAVASWDWAHEKRLNERLQDWAGPIAIGTSVVVVILLLIATINLVTMSGRMLTMSYRLEDVENRARVIEAKLQPPTATTPNNVEAQIQHWSDTFRLGDKKVDSEMTYFAREITLPDGHNIGVMRTKKLDQYLTLRARVGPYNKYISQLSAHDQDILLHKLRVEIIRFNVAYANLGLPMTNIDLEKIVPISDALTEGAFIQQLQEMDFAIAAVQEIFAQELVIRGITFP